MLNTYFLAERAEDSSGASLALPFPDGSRARFEVEGREGRVEVSEGDTVALSDMSLSFSFFAAFARVLDLKVLVVSGAATDDKGCVMACCSDGLGSMESSDIVGCRSI